MRKNFSLLVILILLCAAAAGAYFFLGPQSGMSTAEMSDFGVADTSRVTRFMITDMQGVSADLQRNEDSDLWTLNDEHFARKSAVDLVLKCFQRIAVRAPVSENAKKGVLTNMAAAGKRIDIYIDGELDKSYILGTAAIDHYGSNMLLEKPNMGKSTTPYVVHIEGFSGFLNPRFFTNEDEWRYTGVFEYPNLNFKSVSFKNHKIPVNSFTVNYAGGNDISLKADYIDSEINKFDTLAVKDYLIRFKKVHLETYNNFLDEQREDSLRSAVPDYSIQVVDNADMPHIIDLYEMMIENEEGELEPNGDRLYGKLDSDEIVFVQRYTFGPIIRSLNDFMPK